MKLLLYIFAATMLNQCTAMADKASGAHNAHRSQTRRSDANQRVWVAGVGPEWYAGEACSALRKAHIGCECNGSLGMGVKVRRKDAVRTKSVLAADAKVHHYKVTFYAVK